MKKCVAIVALLAMVADQVAAAGASGFYCSSPWKIEVCIMLAVYRNYISNFIPIDYLLASSS